MRRQGRLAGSEMIRKLCRPRTARALKSPSFLFIYFFNPLVARMSRDGRRGLCPLGGPSVAGTVPRRRATFRCPDLERRLVSRVGSCSGRTSWSRSPKQRSRKSWRGGSGWSSRGRITRPPSPPSPWSFFPVSSGGGRKGPLPGGGGRGGVLSQHGGQGHTCKQVAASQESFRAIRFLRAGDQRSLLLKVKPDKDVLFTLILFRFFFPP